MTTGNVESTTAAALAPAISDDEWSVIKFVPFASAIESAFWVRYFREKLETIRLNEDAIPLRLSYSVSSKTNHRLQCQDTSLLLESSSDQRYVNSASSFANNECVAVQGTLLGYNTLESFQTVNKNQLLHNLFVKQFFLKEADGDTGMIDDAAILRSLNAVVLITFADLKLNKVVYWMGLPTLLPSQSIVGRLLPLASDESATTTAAAAAATAESTEQSRQDATLQFTRAFEAMRQQRLSQDPNSGLPPYFIYCQARKICWSLSVASYHSCKEGIIDTSTLVFGFVDPVKAEDSFADSSSTLRTMGWPLRNLIAYLCFHLKLGGAVSTVLSFRPQIVRRVATGSADLGSVKHDDEQGCSASMWLQIKIPSPEDYQWTNDELNQSKTDEVPAMPYKVVGWELNARAKAGPRSVNLKSLLDPHHLAVQAADLNLKLMKWRMIPDLQVEQLQTTKVLLLGAGTLGCNVARVLLGWGIRHFTIVDYGKVSYSNPVRQSLFTLDDCHADGGSGRSKAQAAAKALQSIAADVHSEGITLSIPMPGHAEQEEAIRESVDTLDRLIQETDVVFLLTDTRESRWLPTVMASAHNKILINAALGLDSWLVMRHGVSASIDTDSTLTTRPRYGCYFCSDVVAPENSTRHRTLDQQCTVTRPGLALIASSMAVELMVAVLHHPLRLSAPAPTVKLSQGNTFATTISSGEESMSGPLGIIPHQIRGSLMTYTMMTPTVPAFPYCPGCSKNITDHYIKDKVSLVMNSCHSADASYLEEIAGLTAYRAESAEKLVGIEGWEEDE